ncbi:MAG: phosphoadenosine phosphosulfate reductase family protein [Desulfovibrio sp.]|jgi:phosphoadenosine phosphosulfate reductase|nr:phosphoadenosine phosphosulfate reductase family protein [Desulfovibrio sp.]
MIQALDIRAKRLVPSLFSVDYMTDEAIDFLRKHEPPEGYFVGFSGGKDSIVTLELCRMAGVKHQAYYSCTRIDPPEIYKFIKQHYPDVIWLYPKMTFWQGIRKNSPPLRMMRWCCNVLKKDPSKHIPLKHRIMGIRAEESAARAARGRINFHDRLKIWQYKPVFRWQEWHVWEFIEQNNLPYPCLYDEGYDRIGCVICPFIMHRNQAKLHQARERYPQMFRVFEKVVADWFLHHTTKASRYSEKTPAEYLEAYYRGFEDKKVLRNPVPISIQVSRIVGTL